MLTAPHRLALVEPRQLVALGLRRPAGGAFATKPRWRACARPARSPARASAAAAARLRSAAPRSSASPARISTVAAGHRARARLDRLAAVARENDSRASRATCSARLLVAVGGEPRGQRRAGLHARRGRASRAAPGPPRSPAPARLGALVDQRRRRLRTPRREQPLGAGHVRVDLLGHERDDRVRQRERLARARAAASARPSRSPVVQARLDELEVPVAELAVDEVVERERGVREVEALDRAATSAVARSRRERIQRSSTVLGADRGAGVAGRPQQDQPRGVPELVGSCGPWAIFSSEKRTSWLEDIASRPQRTASAP